MSVKVRYEIDIIESSTFLKLHKNRTGYDREGELPVSPFMGMYVIVGGVGGRVVDIIYWDDHDLTIRLKPFIIKSRHKKKITDKDKVLIDNGWRHCNGQYEKNSSSPLMFS